MAQHSAQAAQQELQQQEKHRQKRMLTIAIALLALSGTISVGSLCLQRVRANYRAIKTDAGIADMAPEKQAARLERAKEMRGKWEAWAIEHKADLKAMRAGDRAAFQRVVASLPNTTEMARYGLHPKDVCSGPVPFSLGFLNFGVKSSFQPRLGTPEQQAKSQKKFQELKASMARVQEDGFAKFQDVMLFNSSNSGSKSIRLWVGGRITERATVQNPDRTPGKPYFITKEREVVPAYQFVN